MYIFLISPVLKRWNYEESGKRKKQIIYVTDYDLIKGLLVLITDPTVPVRSMVPAW